MAQRQAADCTPNRPPGAAPEPRPPVVRPRGARAHSPRSAQQDRQFGDKRSEACFTQEYSPLEDMPSASVIIIFHNEAVSTLMRTARSVLDKSPPELLEEVRPAPLRCAARGQIVRPALRVASRRPL